jgi:hypothetical protein
MYLLLVKFALVHGQILILAGQIPTYAVEILIFANQSTSPRQNHALK